MSKHVFPKGSHLPEELMFWGVIAYDTCTELMPLPRHPLYVRRDLLENLDDYLVAFSPFIEQDF